MNEERKLVITNQKYQIYIFTIYLKIYMVKLNIYMLTWLHTLFIYLGTYIINNVVKLTNL